MAFAALPRLPRCVVVALAHALGTAAWAVALPLRRIGMANLALALPERTRSERRALLRQSFRTFALTTLDIFWFSRDPHGKINRLVRFDASYDQHLFQAGPVVAISAHLGNWEVLGMGVSLRGFPLASVVAPIKNPRIDPLFNRFRNLTGQIAVPKKGALRQLLRVLKDGNKIALLLDQNTRPEHGAVFVDFFGRPVPVSSAAAMLALRTHATVVVGGCVPDARGHYRSIPIHVVDQDHLPPTEAEAARELTQRITNSLEALVRAEPGHWLWTYKRWRTRPPEQPRERYPFYQYEYRPLSPQELAAGRSRN